MSIDQYSTTPASNDLANYFQTGMRPSSVKNAGWDIMADTASLLGLPTSGGTANAQTISNGRPYASLVAGLVRGSFIPGNTNTGAMTLQIDGLAAKNVYANGAAIIAGMVVSGVVCHYVYDGTNIEIINPQRSSGSFTITLSGMTTTVTGTINYVIGNDGKSVDFWYVNTINGTSNSTTMTGTGIPAAITPATSKRLTPFTVEDSNNNVAGNLVTGISSTWTFGNSLGNAAFTGSATKGLGAAGSTNHYTLD